MKNRLFYLDNLRAAVTVLVILHHAAITYGASGSWYFIEGSTSLVSSVILTVFAVINQSFFMGLFFFLSGYFTPASFDRKGPRRFLADKLIRLGIPLLVYLFLIGPGLLYFLQDGGNRVYGINWGPLWFVAALIYFSFAYALWRYVHRTSTSVKPNLSFPSNKTIAVSALLVGIAAFVIRVFIPVGQEIMGQQLGFFASYIFFYIIGILAYRNNWIENLNRDKAKFWFKIALVLIIIMPVVAIYGGSLGGNEAYFQGGFRPQALFYALWEPFVAFGIVMMLVVLFREKLNITRRFLTTATESAYTAYIIHPPILVAISYLIRDGNIPSLLKFVLVGLSATVIIFVASNLVIKLPYAKRVL